MSNDTTIYPLPVGYRLLKKGERTQLGDIGFMVWDEGNKRAWCELRAGHVVNAIVETPGYCARRATSHTDMGGYGIIAPDLTVAEHATP